MPDLPLLAPVSALANWLGQAIPSDSAQAIAYLGAASTLIRSETGQPWDDPDQIPAEISMVAVQVAARIWLNPRGVVAHTDTVGPFVEVQKFNAQIAEGLFLTDTERTVLARFRLSGSTGLWVQPTNRGEAGLEVQYLEVLGSDEMIPWASAWDNDSWL